MNKLAHYRAVAFVDELEKIAGYRFDDDVREYLYKEAALNIGNLTKTITEGAKKVLANPGQTAVALKNKANMAVLRGINSPTGQAFSNKIMAGGMQTPTDVFTSALGALGSAGGGAMGGKAGGWAQTLGQGLLHA